MYIGMLQYSLWSQSSQEMCGIMPAAFGAAAKCTQRSAMRLPRWLMQLSGCFWRTKCSRIRNSFYYSFCEQACLAQSFGKSSSYPVSAGGFWWSRCWLMVRASNTYGLTWVTPSLWEMSWGRAARSKIVHQWSVVRDKGLKYSYGCEYSFSE